MGSTAVQGDYALPILEPTSRPTIADEVCAILQERILSLQLPPLTKISEAEVAAMMGVSRQPVREAFKRLAKQGFLTIRPQSGTTVSAISEEAVLRARFIRVALEMHTGRTACDTISDDGLAALGALIDQQRIAIADQDRERFHALDDAFHREICKQAGAAYVWDVISENKAHMDRVRYLSLSFASERAYLEHREILAAIRARSPDAAAEAVRRHLTRILDQIVQIRAAHSSYFADEGPA